MGVAEVSALALEREIELPDGYLSASRVILFNKCPACFEAQYVDKKPSKIHIALPFGSAVHSGVQAARSAVRSGEDIDMLTGDYVEIALGAFTDEFQKIEPALRDMGSESLDGIAGRISKVTEAAIRALLPEEKRIGIKAIEAEIDFTDVFPFQFLAYLDVMLVDGTLKDLKTASKAGLPDAYAAFQLTTYGLPWQRAGESVQLQIDQVTKAKGEVTSYRLGVVAEEYQRVERLVVDTALAIQTGIFPPRPGWWCRFDHGLPAFHLPVQGFGE